MSSIVIVGAYADSLINFRGDLIKAFVAAGHRVTALADPADPALVARLAELGVAFRPYPVRRNGMNPASDLRTFLALRAIFAELKPDLVVAYTIKPIIWGGLALRSSRSRARFFAMVTGLGLAFQPGGVKQRALTLLATNLYRLSLRGAVKVIFQNPDNRQVFTGRGIVDAPRTALVNGSGVNLDQFTQAAFPAGEITFLLIARLLGDKGIREYAAAAKVVKAKHPKVRFRLLGPEDPSPDGIPLSEVRQWHDSGVIDYLGATGDVRPYLAGCHVYVLPSYHEGTPRSVLEAMAMGRPVITTDAPGCRETVKDGDNGYLVAVKDHEALAQAMERFISQGELVGSMGRRSRQLAEEKYDVRKVNRSILGVMGLGDEAAL